MSIWKTLEIEATKDKNAIKRAYSKLVKEIDSETEMDKFLNLRNAYEKALSYSETNINNEENPLEIKVQEEFEDEFEEEFEEETLNLFTIKEKEDNALIQLDFLKENVEEFENCEAIIEFKKLYFEKNCKDQNLWIKYVTSPEFLEVYQQFGFTKVLSELILPQVRERKGNRAFLELLPIIYVIAKSNEKDVVSYKVNVSYTFYGIENIHEILKYRVEPTRVSSANHLGILKSFEDYQALCQLTASGVWNDAIGKSFDDICSRYVSAYIYDKITENNRSRGQYDFLPRHISSLRILTYFFQNTNLPKEAYKIIWKKWDLKSATMGKNKILYGSLRDVVVSKIPELLENEEKKPESFFELRKEILKFFVSLIDKDDKTKRKMLDDFYGKEDIKTALENQNFVQADVLSVWTASKLAPCLEKLISYCEENSKVWLGEEIILRAKKTLKNNEKQRFLEEDNVYKPIELDNLIKHRSFFRYFIYSAFPYAISRNKVTNLRDNPYLIIGGNTHLRTILAEEFPFASNWADGFLDYNDVTDSYSEPKKLNIEIGENKVEVIFHLSHVEYLLNEKPVLAPMLSFSNLCEDVEDLIFWLLLPISVATTDENEIVTTEIEKRLIKFEFLKNISINAIASCVAGAVCQLNDKSSTPLMLTLQNEAFRNLYTANIYTENFYVQIFKTTISGIRTLIDNREFENLDEAINFANIEINKFQESMDIEKLELTNLPFVLSTEVVKREEIKIEPTYENVIKALKDFKKGLIKRVAMAWNSKLLVFMKDNKNYGCFIFDNKKQSFSKLVSDPGTYEIIDVKDVTYSNFHLGKLENYCVHKNIQSVYVHLEAIINDAQSSFGLSRIWATEVYLHNKKVYQLDKSMLGGLPIQREGNTPFYIKEFPTELEVIDKNNEESKIKVGAQRSKVQDTIYSYFMGRVKAVKLVWKYVNLENNFETIKEIQLLQEENKYCLSYYNSVELEENILISNLEKHCLSECENTLNVSVCNKEFKDYCVHNEFSLIRGYMHILLANINNAEHVINATNDFYKKNK